MTRRIRTLPLAIVAGLLVTTLAISAIRATPAHAATVEYVSLNNKSELTPATDNAAIAVAGQIGANVANGRSVTIGMRRLLRGDVVVQQPPVTYFIPMGITALSVDAVSALMGPDVATVLQANDIVLCKTSADMRGAQVGDVAEFLNTAGAVVRYRIGMIADDSTIGGAEFVVSDAQADVLGLTIVTRVVIWGFTDRATIEAALAANGLINAKVRVNRSWDIASPDSTLGLAKTKALLGEFPYRVTRSGVVQIPSSWTAANISGGGRRTYFASIRIRAACHNLVRPAIQGALTEIRAAGLAGAINLANTNRYGGCFYPRFVRQAGNIGSLSRHSWGMALDTNTTANPQGGVPHMDCRVVQIFRKWGFAWGGNFLFTDGMHFEYVGAARDQLGYPSKYCPTGVGIPPYPDPPTTTTTAPVTTQPVTTQPPATQPPTDPATAAVVAPAARVKPAAVVSERSVMFGSDGFTESGD
jgi:D-alanyl-D-alanine carboxypeptidase